MSLPSQTARPIARRTFMHARNRRRRMPRILAYLAVAFAAILLIWVIWPSGPDEPAADDGGAMLMTGVGSVPAEVERSGPASTDAARNAPASESRTSEPPVRDTPKPSLARHADPGAETPAVRTAPPGTPRPEAMRRPARKPAPTTGNRARLQIERGRDLLSRNEPIEGRRVLSAALRSGDLDAADARAVREELTKLNEKILFGPHLAPDDPFAFTYTIQPTQALSLLPRKLGLQADWRLIQYINRIPYPERVRAGQTLKVATGPFHAVVHKSDFRMDIFMGEEDALVYVCSFRVGLGELNSTPEVRFRVKKDSKLINPSWQNPRTGERFDASDPLNPIGERWLGLVPEDERLRGVHVGFGIHGTIDPDSIGTQASMGCIRLGTDDVKLVWSMLMESVSSVEVVR